MPALWIFSFSSDFHAHAISHRMRTLGYMSDVRFVPIDRLVGSEQQVRLLVTNNAIRFGFASREVDIHPGDVIWARRINPFSFKFLFSAVPEEQDFFAGSLADLLRFIHRQHKDAIWINDLIAGQENENKLVQASYCRDIGFPSPNTIATNDFHAAAAQELLGRGVLKSLRSPPGRTLPTLEYSEALQAVHDLRFSPCIIQDRILGSYHARVVALGPRCIGGLYMSTQVDSRPDYDKKMIVWDVPPYIRSFVSSYLRRAGLRMGVFDFRGEDPDRMVFLECNQQGQFAYLQPKLNIDVLSTFCDFVRHEVDGLTEACG